MIRSKSQAFLCNWRHASGTLLLALPLCGLVIQTKPVAAQPATNPPTSFQPAPLTPEQTKAIDRISSISRYEEFCKMPLDLKLEDGTIDDAVKRIKAAFPTQRFEIRQRDARPLKLSLNLKETTVGSVLSGMAALADCRLWVMPDGLLIAPPAKLTKAEQELVGRMDAGEWTQSGENPENQRADWGGNVSWSAETNGQMLMANIIADEIKLLKVDGPVKTTFGQFSPQTQKALRQLVDWSNAGRAEGYPLMRPLLLSSDSPVKVSFTKPKWISIDLTKGASDPSATEVYMDLLLSE